MAIEVEILKNERESLKLALREVEAEQRKLDAQVKRLRQREIHIKREVEALSTLIEIDESRNAETAG